jgi:hypothetical protein
VLLVLLTLTLGGSLVHAGDPTTSGSDYTQWECIRHDSDGTYDHEQVLAVAFGADGAVRFDMVVGLRQIQPDCFVQGVYDVEVGQVTPYNQGYRFQVQGDEASLDTCHNQVTHKPVTQVLYYELKQHGNQLEFADGQYFNGQTQKFLPLPGLFRGCLADRIH